MPQFELDGVGPERISGLFRGRSTVEVVRRSGGIPENAEVVIADGAETHGWQLVRIEGEASGRVRVHQRMRFRRD